MVTSATSKKKSYPFLEILKEIYLTIFVIFYRAGSGLWPTEFEIDSQKGVAGVTITQSLIFINLINSTEIKLGSQLRFSSWIIAIFFLILFQYNSYSLLSKENGLDFERKFNSFQFKKRMFLRVCAGLFFLLVLVSTYFVTTESRRGHCQVNSTKAQIALIPDFRQRWLQPSTQHSRSCETGGVSFGGTDNLT